MIETAETHNAGFKGTHPLYRAAPIIAIDGRFYNLTTLERLDIFLDHNNERFNRRRHRYLKMTC